MTTPSSTLTATRRPIYLSASQVVFGGRVDDILPPLAEIPPTFRNGSEPWARWASQWFHDGLERWPVARVGIDAQAALANLTALLRSCRPSQPHKEAGAGYLASLWFEHPDGDPIESRVERELT